MASQAIVDYNDGAEKEVTDFEIVDGWLKVEEKLHMASPPIRYYSPVQVDRVTPL